MAECVISNNNNDGMNSSRIRVINFLVGKGLTPRQACAFCGNIQAESGFNSTITDGDKANNKHSKGLIQWTGSRDKNLRDFAEKKGKPYTDFDLQLEFIWYELEGSEKATLTYLRSNPGDSLDTCTEKICDLYERAGVRAIPKRQSYAREAMQLYNSLAKGECKITDSTSSSTNVDTQSTISGGDLSDICQRLINGLNALLGGGSINVNTSSYGDVVSGSSSEGGSIIGSSNTGKPLLVGDSWAKGMSIAFKQKTGGVDVSVSGSRPYSSYTLDGKQFVSAKEQMEKYGIDQNKPKYILCHTGFNLYTEVQKQSYVDDLIKAANGCLFFWVGIPLTNHWRGEQFRDLNFIKGLNKNIESGCNRFANAVYVWFTDDEARQIQSWCGRSGDDSYHLTPSTYPKFFELIVKHVREKGYDLISGSKIS